MNHRTNQDGRLPGEWPLCLQQHIPATFLPEPDEPPWRAGIPAEATYHVLIGCLAAHIELQPDRRAATRRTIRDLCKAVDNLPGQEASE